MIDLFEIADYGKRIEGYQARSTSSRLRPGPPSRCCRACITVVRKKNLKYAKYGNGWMLGNTMDWSCAEGAFPLPAGESRERTIAEARAGRGMTSR